MAFVAVMHNEGSGRLSTAMQKSHPQITQIPQITTEQTLGQIGVTPVLITSDPHDL
jgi:hypothetical protein